MPSDRPNSIHRFAQWLAGTISSLALIIEVQAQEAPLANPVQRGETVAKAVCVNCHLFPDPSILDKATWKKGALPLMHKQLGIAALSPDNPEGRQILSDWSALEAYYAEKAPAEALPQVGRLPISTNLLHFDLLEAPYTPAAKTITLVRVDAASHRIFAGNGEGMTVDVLNAAGTLLQSNPVRNPPVGLELRGTNFVLTMIGSVSPSDNASGKVSFGSLEGDQLKFAGPELDHLKRPTGTTKADLNGDGREDLVITTFGHTMGSFNWYEALPAGGFEPHILIDRPGAIQAYVRDFNNDGRPDVLVMMAQGKEGIFLLINLGDGKFFETTVVERHPSWGSSSMQLADFNGDGAPDILATNGDNGEYDSCTKNYHGIRIYLNDGKGNFRESWFYPMHGAFKAMAADFDGDGDLDIAAISYFPDYDHLPEEGFLYLRNEGSRQKPGPFSVSTFPHNSRGRWLTMDVGDLDGDGRPDIVLGAANRAPFHVPPEIAQFWSKGPAVLILKNKK